MHGRTGAKCNAWKGGITIVRGYRYVRRPEHPDATKQGRIAEHRLVLAGSLGRRLLRHECVHHINGDKLDNRPENLELMNASAHIYEHLPVQHTKRFTGFVNKQTCAGCGVLFKPRRAPRCKNVYCSKKCFHDSIRGQ